MATITRRSDGRFCTTYQLHGVRKYLTGTSEREVQAKLDALKGEAARHNGLTTPGQRTVTDLVEEALATLGDLKPRTRSDYRSLHRRYIQPAIGPMRLAKLQPIHVQRLYRDLADRGLKRAPAQLHAFLHRAFKLGVLWGWLADNPCDRVVPPRYRTPRKDVWDREQLAAFLKGAAEHRYYPLWLLLIGTGLRLGEALGLTWPDVDLSRGALTIHRNAQRIEGEWIHSTPKTRSGERQIGLPGEVVATLKRWKARQAEWRLKAGPAWPATTTIFTWPSGKALHHGEIEHALTAECDRLSLPRLTPHQFRHLHASLLLDAGLPIPQVSARLGHSRPSITMSIYAHKLGGDDRPVVEAISAAIGGGR